MSKSHHNTTHESGQLLIQFNQSAEHQEKEILKTFILASDSAKHIYARFTPSEMHERMKRLNPGIPITSVRRAFTNLTKQKQLLKTDSKKVGPLGHPEYVWELARIDCGLSIHTYEPEKHTPEETKEVPQRLLKKEHRWRCLVRWDGAALDDFKCETCGQLASLPKGLTPALHGCRSVIKGGDNNG